MEYFDLQRFRKDVGITQQQLAQVLSVPQSFVSQVENRKDPMPPAWKDLLATTYNISDISEYITIVDCQSNSFNDISGVAGVGVSVSNELGKLLEYLKTHDQIMASQLKSKDEIITRSQNQIDRLITLLEKTK